MDGIKAQKHLPQVNFWKYSVPPSAPDIKLFVTIQPV
jgi:hypothetical protein